MDQETNEPLENSEKYQTAVEAIKTDFQKIIDKYTNELSDQQKELNDFDKRVNEDPNYLVGTKISVNDARRTITDQLYKIQTNLEKYRQALNGLETGNNNLTINILKDDLKGIVFTHEFSKKFPPERRDNLTGEARLKKEKEENLITGEKIFDLLDKIGLLGGVIEEKDKRETIDVARELGVIRLASKKEMVERGLIKE